jgi:lysozyme
MMTQEMSSKLKRSVVNHEDRRNFPYIDTANKITIGIGYNLSDRGMPDWWIDEQYESDAEYFYNQLSTFPWFSHLNMDRQIVLIDMSFMGIKRLLTFNKMIEYLSTEDYDNAAKEMLDSDWAKEVGQRAIDLSQGMLTGVYNV